MTMKWYLLIPAVWAVLMVWVIVAIARRDSRKPKSLRERFSLANTSAFTSPRPPLPPVPEHLCPGCALRPVACVCFRGREVANRSLERHYRRVGALKP